MDIEKSLRQEGAGVTAAPATIPVRIGKTDRAVTVKEPVAKTSPMIGVMGVNSQSRTIPVGSPTDLPAGNPGSGIVAVSQPVMAAEASFRACVTRSMYVSWSSVSPGVPHASEWSAA